MKTMKTLLMVLAILSATHTSSQTSSTKKTNVQIRGGLNISTLTATDGDNVYSANAKLGYNVGAILDLSLGKGMYLQTGGMITSKGAKFKNYDIESTRVNISMDALYIKVPLLVAYKIELANSSNKIGFAIGPYYAYGIGGKMSIQDRSSSISVSDNTFDENNGWNKQDIGIGFQFTIESSRIIFITGSEIGITDAWKKDNNNPNVNVRNNVWHVGMGIKL